MEIRLDLLDPIDLIEQKTAQEILTEIDPSNKPASDPEGRINRGWAVRESYRRSEENNNAKSLILATASGIDLDHIGATYYRNSDGSQILRKDGESDDDYRLALQESPEGLTSAGTLKSYDYHASRAHALVDRYKVKSSSPEPMVMHTYFISDDDLEAEIKAAIENYLVKFIPGGDQYTAIRATSKTAVLTGVVRCDRGIGRELIESQGLALLNTYLTSAKLIKGIISDSSIKTALTVPGVVQIVLDGWSDIVCDNSEYPEVIEINLTYESI